MTDPKPRPPSQRASTVVEHPAHRAATLAHAEAQAARDAATTLPPPAAPRLPQPTPASPLPAPVAPDADPTGEVSARAWASDVRALPLDERLDRVIDKVAELAASSVQKWVRLRGIESLVQTFGAQLEALGKTHTDLTKTLQDNTDLALAAHQKSARASAIAEVASRRVGDLEERGSVPSTPLATLLADTINEQRPGSQRGHKLAPGLSLPPGRAPATEDDLAGLRQDVAELKAMMVVASRGDRAHRERLDAHDTGLAWVRKRLGWVAFATAVGGYAAKLSYEAWSARHPLPHTPSAVLARPAGSTAPVPSGDH